MGYFTDNFMELLPQVYSLSGKKRVKSATAAAGNTGDDTLVVGGMFFGTENDTYTVTVTTGGAPPACSVAVTSRKGDDSGPITIPLHGFPVRITGLGLNAKWTDGGDGVLTAGDSWEIEVTAGDLHDFAAILGTGLDGVETLIDGLAALVDVDNVPVEYLPYLGALLDYDYDRTRDPEVQRAEIRNAILAYRMRGTKPGILRALRLAGYEAEIFEPYAKTIKLNTAGRGLGTGCKLTGAMYSHCTFEVLLQEVCRELWDLLWDQIPRGTRMFASHTLDLVTDMPFNGEAYVTGDSDFSLGTGRYPFRLFSGTLQLEIT